MNKYCWFFGGDCREPKIELCYECPHPTERYKVDRSTNMFKENMHEYVRMILRTKNSYNIMDEVIKEIEDIGQRRKLRAQLGECMKDCDRLIDELKKHGHLY